MGIQNLVSFDIANMGFPNLIKLGKNFGQENLSHKGTEQIMEKAVFGIGFGRLLLAIGIEMKALGFTLDIYAINIAGLAAVAVWKSQHKNGFDFHGKDAIGYPGFGNFNLNGLYPIEPLIFTHGYPMERCRTFKRWKIGHTVSNADPIFGLSRFKFKKVGFWLTAHNYVKEFGSGEKMGWQRLFAIAANERQKDMGQYFIKSRSNGNYFNEHFSL